MSYSASFKFNLLRDKGKWIVPTKERVRFRITDLKALATAINTWRGSAARFPTGNFVMTYSSKANKRYQQIIKMSAMARGPRTPIVDSAFIVHIIAHFPVPESWPKWKKDAALMGMIVPTVKPDFDNIGKIICDSLNGVIWKDDSQVCRGVVDKIYARGSLPYVQVDISERPQPKTKTEYLRLRDIAA